MLTKNRFLRSEILSHRQIWADFLMKKGRKKATAQLDAGGGSRCCLGHGCYVMGLKPKRESLGGSIYYNESYEMAPVALVEWLGLWDVDGSTRNNYPIDVFNSVEENKEIDSEYDEYDMHSNLAAINDETDATPKQIGEYILKVIDGGKNTPFRPLSDFPEKF